jgi:DUF4097 and DUF4098 domain-containing protein YvlB
MASMPPPPPGRPPGPPPNTPPYGAPFGANPKDYWRYQKEQNKAAWRAQRDAWRAQRSMMRSQYRQPRVPSIAGPIILIGVGIIALLLITGHLDADRFWDVVGRWWPLMLIGLGLVALAEWAVDLRKENPPVRHYGGYVWLVILVLFLVAGGAGWHRFWGPLRAEMGDNGDSFFNAFGRPQHDIDQAVLDTAIPADAQIEIQSPRGDVNITAADQPNISVKAHQIAYANSDSDAQKIFDAEQAHVTVSGKAVLVKVDSSNSGRTNLTITVPKSASVNVTTNHGGLTIAGLNGNVDAQLQHGDMAASAIQGYVHAHISNSGDFSAHDIQGDVTLEGNGGDLTLSDIHGKVVLQGEYTGDTHLERVSQSFHFHSSRTDMDIERLPGDLSLNSDTLHATQVIGPVRLATRSKDIELNQVTGETHIQDRNGRVELDMAGSFPVEVKNEKGDVEIALPANANVTVDAHTHNGDIVSDFPLTVNGEEDKTLAGNIGKGGPKVEVSTEHADLRIRKAGDAAPPAAPATPKAPAPPKNVPHLKTQKAEEPATVSQ